MVSIPKKTLIEHLADVAPVCAKLLLYTAMLLGSAGGVVQRRTHRPWSWKEPSSWEKRLLVPNKQRGRLTSKK